MEYCCVCLGECVPAIVLNSGTTICDFCATRIQYCPATYIKLLTKLPNNFAAKFFRLPPPPPIFNIIELFESPNRIAYMNQFDQIILNELNTFVFKLLLNIDDFKVFVDKCVNIDYEDIDGMRLIHYACRDNRLDMVKYLVQRGANIIDRYIDNYGSNYPIHCACINGDKALELVKYLVEHGADVNCTDYAWWCPIHYACSRHNAMELVKYLVAHGADVNCDDNEGCYPIHYACLGGDEELELVKYLVAHGADVNCIDYKGCRPIHWACYGGDGSLELVKYLVAHDAYINCVNNDNRRPIHIACMKRGETLLLVKYLVEIGAKYYGRLPIQGVDEEPLEIAKYLIDNIDHIDDKKWSPIYYASCYVSLESIKCFIRYNAYWIKSNIASRLGKLNLFFSILKMDYHCCVCFGDDNPHNIINSGTTLCSGCIRDFCPTTRIKITTIIPNNFTTNFFRMPQRFNIKKMLQLSDKIAYMNQFDEIELDDPNDLINYRKFLLNINEFKVFASKCINLHRTVVRGKCLFHHACSVNDLEMVKCLVEKGADVNCKFSTYNDRQPIHVACNWGDAGLELVKYLIDHGADIMSCENLDGMYPINIACGAPRDPVELVKYLVEHGADISNDNDWCQHPIHSSCNNFKVVKYLVECGADVNRIDNYGASPIHNFMNSSEEDLEMVKYLIYRGADVNCADQFGITPIHKACVRGDKALDIIRCLISYGADVNCIDKYGRTPIYIARQNGGLEVVKYLINNGAK